MPSIPIETDAAHDLSEVCLIIPTHNPDRTLVDRITALRALGFPSVLVVDDGSPPTSAAIFERIAPAVQRLRLAHPQGRGAALKTALIALQSSQYRYAITLDADGQNPPEDVLRLATAALAAREPAVWLGAYRMPAELPLHRRIGRRLKRKMLGLLTGHPMSDTPSGLRGIPCGLLPELTQLHGEPGDYELEMLGYFIQHHIPLQEVAISATALTGNAGARAIPLRGAVRIYWVLCKEVLLAAASLALDLLLFALLLRATSDIFASTVVARVLSALFNFAGNRLFVFRGRHVQRLLPQLLGYGLLAAAIMLASAVSVEWLVARWGSPPILTKIGVDGMLYIASFAIRSSWLFRLRGDHR